jgi:PAS domain-containing protein
MWRTTVGRLPPKLRRRFGWSAHVAIPRRLYDAPFGRAVWYLIAALSGAFSLSALFFEFLRREALRRQHQLDLTEAAKRKAEQALTSSACVTAASQPSAKASSSATPSSGPPIIYVNAAFEQLTGYSAAEVLGRTVASCRAETIRSTSPGSELVSAGRGRSRDDRKLPQGRQLLREPATDFPSQGSYGKLTHSSASER